MDLAISHTTDSLLMCPIRAFSSFSDKNWQINDIQTVEPTVRERGEKKLLCKRQIKLSIECRLLVNAMDKWTFT